MIVHTYLLGQLFIRSYNICNVHENWWTVFENSFCVCSMDEIFDTWNISFSILFTAFCMFTNTILTIVYSLSTLYVIKYYTVFFHLWSIQKSVTIFSKYSLVLLFKIRFSLMWRAVSNKMLHVSFIMDIYHIYHVTGINIYYY